MKGMFKLVLTNKYFSLQYKKGKLYKIESTIAL